MLGTDREAQQNQNCDECCRSQDGERGTDHLANPRPLSASVGVGDKANHTSLESQVGDAQIAG